MNESIAITARKTTRAILAHLCDLFATKKYMMTFKTLFQAL